MTSRFPSGQTICLTFAGLIACLSTTNNVVAQQQKHSKPTDEVQWVRDGKVAGRSLEEWNSDFKSDHEIVRARAAKTLALFGESATAPLIAALRDSSDAVRYWAACGLGMLELDSNNTNYNRAIESLKELETQADQKPTVATAAAYALCRLEGTQGHIDLLIQQVQIPDRAIACSTADLLKQIGPPAKAAIPVLRATYQKHSGKAGSGNPVDYHIRGACLHAIRQIDPDVIDPDFKDKQ